MGERFEGFYALIARQAQDAPDHICAEFLDTGQRLTAAELLSWTHRLSRWLDQRGIGAGARVMMLGENSLEYYLLFLACLAHGAVVCPVNIDYAPDDIRALADKIDPALTLCDDGLDADRLGRGNGHNAARGWAMYGRLNDMEDDVFGPAAMFDGDMPITPKSGPDDIGLIVHTSGTEAEPKGVIHSFASYYFNCEACALKLDLGPEDRVLEYRTLSWLSPMVLTIGPALIARSTFVLARHFSQSRFFDWIAENAITVAAGVPTVINMLLARRDAFDRSTLPRLKFLTSSSAPLTLTQHHRFEDLFDIPIIQLYGVSEAGWVSANSHLARKIGSVGQAMTYQTVRILSDDGAPLANGEIGEIEASGPQLSYGYLLPGGIGGRIERFGAVPRKTGDMGYIDADGFLFVTGRKRDLIIRGGVNIAPIEIDNVLMRHAAILEAATIGVPDDIYGERIVCYVTCKDGENLTEDTVRTHCQANLAAYKVPADIHFIDRLPKTQTAKINRQDLRDLWTRTHGKG